MPKNFRGESLKNRRFGRLTVLDLEQQRSSNNRVLWRCRCDCGKVKVVKGQLLRAGVTRSCGCLRKVPKKHGMCDSLTYSSWVAMKRRMLSIGHHAYQRYGGRGLILDPRWLEFKNFLDDMGERPGKEYTIERINNDLGYYKSNCKWATMLEQQRNKNNVVRYEFKGKKKTLREWCEELGLSLDMVKARIRKKWPLKKALTTPPIKNGLSRRYFRLKDL